MKFYETVDFRRLHRDWTRRLAASGFRDIETADGEFADPDTKREVGADDFELGYDFASRAHDALENEMVWAGLSRAHRRFWALLIMGMSERVAGVLAHGTRGGRGREKSRVWRQEIIARIERQP
jgi:hypothetical protein